MKAFDMKVETEDATGKIRLVGLDPTSDYIILVNPALVKENALNNIIVPHDIKIQVLYVADVDKAVKFIEIPKHGKDGNG